MDFDLNVLMLVYLLMKMRKEVRKEENLWARLKKNKKVASPSFKLIGSICFLPAVSMDDK